jgi:protein-tyrosine phosphatase
MVPVPEFVPQKYPSRVKPLIAIIITVVGLFTAPDLSAAPADGESESGKSIPSGPFERFQVFQEGLFGGSEPDSPEHFEFLRSMGVRAVLSVDGATPNAGEAARHGIRYFHVPIGYDGVPVEKQAGMVRVLREADGPVFIHCHHGKHRGPAAAACLLVATGAISNKAGLRILEESGTSSAYKGLFEAVQESGRLSQDQIESAELPPAMVDPGDAAARMADIDRLHDSIKAIRKNGWQTIPASPDQTPERQALLLYEALVEFDRLVEDEDISADFRRLSRDSIEAAGALSSALSGVEASRVAIADQAAERLRKSCSACHEKFRN